jgi:redox-sensing transcriptional repressor
VKYSLFFHEVPAKSSIPRKSIYRLSVYSRCLTLLSQNNVATVSSDTLAKAAGVKPAQLRKDLGYIGNIGRRGIGYNVKDLLNRINSVMGTTHLLPVILVGVGNLGTALLSYQGFAKEGFEIVAAFDIDPARPREKGCPVPLLGMDQIGNFIRSRNVQLAILTVPAASAQQTANGLIEAGIKGILNFSPIVLAVPNQVMVNNVNLAIELENLAYFVR